RGPRRISDAEGSQDVGRTGGGVRRHTRQAREDGQAEARREPRLATCTEVRALAETVAKQRRSAGSPELFGPGARTRTGDPVVNSHLLDRLSYAGTEPKTGSDLPGISRVVKNKGHSSLGTTGRRVRSWRRGPAGPTAVPPGAPAAARGWAPTLTQTSPSAQ